jgi:hypothetical protein
MFRSTIWRYVGLPYLAGHRCDVDHPAPTRLDHPGDEGLGTEKGAGDVDRHDPLPVLETYGFERRRGGDAGVVDQNIHRSQELSGLLDQVLHLFGVGDVAGHSPGVAPQLAQTLGDTLDLIGRPGADDYPGSGLRQRPGYRGTNPTAATGDHRPPVFE